MPIGATIYKMGIDTSQFVAGSTLTRAELKLTKQILKETATETEKYGAVLSKVNNLVNKQAISVHEANIVLGQAREEQLRGIPVIGDFVAGLHRMGIVGAVSAAAAAGLTIAVREVNEEMGRIDEMVNLSQNLGVTTARFEQLAGGADFADIEMNQFASGMQQMEVQVAKAASGLDKAKVGFDIIGLEAGKLINLRPDQAFLQIVDALGKTENAFKRARAAQAIFGSADFARIMADDIGRATNNIVAMGGAITEHGINKVEKMDKAVKDATQSWNEMKKQMAITAAPGKSFTAQMGTLMARDVSAFGGMMARWFREIRNWGIPERELTPFERVQQAIGRFKELDAGAPAVKDIVDVTGEQVEKNEEHRRKRFLKMQEEDAKQLERSREQALDAAVEEEEKKRKQMERDLAETRRILWDEGVKEAEEGHRKMLRDMAEAEKKEDRAREIVADMEEDELKRARQIQQGRTTVGIRQGSREALEAVTRANRAPQIVSAPEMTRAQREAVELLRKIEAKEPIMVVEESL